MVSQFHGAIVDPPDAQFGTAALTCWRVPPCSIRYENVPCPIAGATVDLSDGGLRAEARCRPAIPLKDDDFYGIVRRPIAGEHIIAAQIASRKWHEQRQQDPRTAQPTALK